MDNDIIQLAGRLGLNAPLDLTDEVKDCYGDTVQKVFKCEIIAGNAIYYICEIDYEHEPYYHTVIHCKDFELCVKDYSHGFGENRGPELTIRHGEKDHIIESFTLIKLVHPEYFKD